MVTYTVSVESLDDAPGDVVFKTQSYRRAKEFVKAVRLTSNKLGADDSRVLCISDGNECEYEGDPPICGPTARRRPAFSPNQWQGDDVDECPPSLI